MNQFWAMLRDSFREAIDGWVFFTMFILGSILIVLVGSVSISPVSADRAIPKMLGGSGNTQAVIGDRGQSDRTAIFLYKQEVADITTTDAATDRPWTQPVSFTLRFIPTGRGAAGIETEVDDKGQPKLDKLDKINKDSVMLGDPFREAVRYWAKKPGEEKPAYTDDLAREFIIDRVRADSGLNVTTVTPKKAKDGGGLLGGILGGPTGSEFAIEADHGTRIGWAFEPKFLLGLIDPGWAFALGTMVHFLESRLVNGVGVWIILMIGVIVTAGFIPNMLRKGQIDLLISKPIARPLILLYKYIGGLVFVFLLTAYSLGGVWLIVGLRAGVWAPGLLWCIPVVTGYFAILYALSTLVGVLTRNMLVSILATILFWFMLWLIGFANTAVKTWEVASKIDFPDQPVAKAGEPPPPPVMKVSPPKWYITDPVYILYKALPRTNDLDELSSKLIADSLLSEGMRKQQKSSQAAATWAGTIGVSAAWIGIFLGLALLRFVTRSY